MEMGARLETLPYITVKDLRILDLRMPWSGPARPSAVSHPSPPVPSRPNDNTFRQMAEGGLGLTLTALRLEVDGFEAGAEFIRQMIERMDRTPLSEAVEGEYRFPMATVDTRQERAKK